MSRSSYYFARKHPPKPTRADLWDIAKRIFERTPNGCGHRQMMLTLRHEFNQIISKKTTLKMMREAGLKCQIRRKSFRPYSSYKGIVGKVASDHLKRDFKAEKPWQKLGTDVTEFAQSWGKAYLAPIYDFCSKEIISWSISTSPNMQQQRRLLQGLLSKMPSGTHPILHSDRGWQYQQKYWINTLKKNGIRQSMSRKGNCYDNAATEQVFGHLKDEFFRARQWKDFESFQKDLNNYIVHWNTKRRQVKLNGLTPEEFRRQSVKA